MRRLLAIMLSGLVLAPVAQASADAPPFADDTPELVQILEAASAEISGKNIYDCIDKITTEAPYHYRVMGTPSSELFVQRHAKEFSTMSPRLKDQVVAFSEGGANPGGVTGQYIPDGGKNIIGVLPGEDLTRWIVLGGHYDTREETAGGAAIDNTSGICTVKEIARAITKLDLKPKLTLVFAWWDGEEWGLFGARAFVKDHNATKELLGLAKETHVELVMGHSYDIVGINYPAYNTWVAYGDQSKVLDEYAVLNLRTAPVNPDNFTLCPNYACYTKITERDDFDHVLANFTAYNGLVREVALKFLDLPWKWVNVSDDKYGRSDHMPFIAAGVPGMRIQGSHDGQWPHYHRASDTLPAAVSMAGGVERLQSGFDTAASTGGLTAIYIAMTGGYGTYGSDRADTGPSSCTAGSTADGGCITAAAKPTPGPSLLLVACLVGLALALRRRT